MANIKSAIKRVKQSERRRNQNRVYRGTARTYVKKTRSHINAGDVENAEETLKEAIKALDKAAQKGVIHKNNAARRKSRLMKALNKVKAV